MVDQDPYQILGITTDATESEIKQAYQNSVSTCLEKNGSLQDFYDISSAYTALSNATKSMKNRDKNQKPRVLVKNPGGETLWKKGISPAYMLGLVFAVITGGLIGYSLQPKQTNVGEVNREAKLPNTTSIPVTPPDSNRIKRDLPNSQPVVDRASSKVAIASNPLPPSQKTTARINPNAVRPTTEKSTPILSGTAKPSRVFPTTSQAEQRAVRSRPGKPVPIQQSPASTQSFASAKPPEQTPIQKSVPNTSSPAGAPADKPRDQIDTYKPSQQSPQAPGGEPRQQSNVTTLSTRLIPMSSTEKILGNIQIPMEDGTSVPANKLLHLDTVVWKLDKGETRKKIVLLVNELMESKNLHSACAKADISLDSLRVLIKKYGDA